MKNKIFILLFIFLTFNFKIFAKGKTEEKEIIKQNDEWILCVTDFNLDSMPIDKRTAAGAITQKIVNRLSAINYRTRVSAEYAYYEELAWSRAKTNAAKLLSSKLDERSTMIYRGDPEWKYKQNLTRVDADIEKLRTAYQEIENNAPVINNAPMFKLTDGNMASSFPATPKPGEEYKFCSTQKADAFLTGSIMDFYGRYYVVIKLYALYTRTVIYEDSIIFSTDDLDSVLDEMTANIISVISGSKPSAITVKTEPENALVLINQSFTGRGNSKVTEFPPGKITLTAMSENYESQSIETELSSGELMEIDILLTPVEFGYTEVFPVSSKGDILVNEEFTDGEKTENGFKVYHGALYVGDAPLTIRLPVNIMDYFEVETPDNNTGSVVFNTPQRGGMKNTLFAKTSKPVVKGMVDKERRNYYLVWGGTWLTGIAAWITNYTYNGLGAAVNQNGVVDQKLFDDYKTMNYIRWGSDILFGGVAIYGIYQAVRYVVAANKDTPAMAKKSKDIINEGETGDFNSKGKESSKNKVIRDSK